MSSDLRFYDNPVANDYALTAESMRDKAIDEALPKRTRGRAWTVGELCQNGRLDLPRYIVLNVNAYEISSQEQLNAKAYRIPQREVGYLSQAQIEAGYSVGTDNLQQCVAVIVDGVDVRNGQRLVALAHVDKYVTSESLKEVFRHFDRDLPLSIKLHGARDQGSQQVVSADNLEMVQEVIKECGLIHCIDPKHKAGIPSTHHNIIYDPRTCSIREDQYPNGGYQVASMVQGLRILQNSREERDFRQGTVVERKATLRVRELRAESVVMIGEGEAYKILQYYGEHGMSTQYKELEAAWAGIREMPSNIPECCARSLEPFAQIVSKAFQAIGQEVAVADIYRDQRREVAQELYAGYKASLMQQTLLGKMPAAAAAAAVLPPPMSKDKLQAQQQAQFP